MKLKKGLKLGPIILIGLGAIFLLNNFGVLPWDIWNNLWKFWPVLIILIGIEFILGSSVSWKTLLILVLIIFLAPLLITFNPFTNNPLATDKFTVSEPLGSLTKAKIIIDMPATNLNIKAGDEKSNNLVEGVITYSKATKKPETSRDQTFGQEIFNIRQVVSAGLPFVSALRNRCDLSLTQQIPLELQINTGASSEQLDLNALRINYLEINSQASNLKIMFDPIYSSTAKINSKASNIELVIPKELQARIKVDSKVKNLNADPRFKKNGSEYKTEGFDKAFVRLDVTIEAIAGSITVK